MVVILVVPLTRATYPRLGATTSEVRVVQIDKLLTQLNLESDILTGWTTATGRLDTPVKVRLPQLLILSQLVNFGGHVARIRVLPTVNDVGVVVWEIRRHMVRIRLNWRPHWFTIGVKFELLDIWWRAHVNGNSLARNTLEKLFADVPVHQRVLKIQEHLVVINHLYPLTVSKFVKCCQYHA